MLFRSRDCSATFQFLVDEMRDWRFIAPDHRGYGKTQWNPQGYWFHDYLADLEVILDTLVPDRALPLVGHSLGGQIVSTFAAVRPDRVTKLISLDAFGLVDENPEKTPDLITRWMDAWRDGPEPSRAYASVEELAVRLRQTNERLSMDKALFLAAESSRRRPDGRFEWSFDPHHRTPFPIPHRKTEWAANMKRIEAPALWLASGRVSRIDKEEPGGIAARAIAGVECALVDIAARARNISCTELLGGPTRDRVRLYWSHCGTTRVRHHEMVGAPPIYSWADVTALGKEVVARGFTALKTNIVMPGKGGTWFSGFDGSMGPNDEWAPNWLIAHLERHIGTLREIGRAHV